MSTESTKRVLAAQFARVAKALAHEHRIELLELLAQCERTVEALAEECALPIANVSQHLQQLRRAGLVTAQRDGKYVRYRLADSEVVTLLGTLRRVAERNLTEVREVVERYVDGRDGLEPVDMDELSKRMADGLVTVIDVRPEVEFRQGHLPGAINVPLSELDARLAALPAAAEIVAYCRGPYCMLAVDAVALLRRRGRRARRLAVGFPEWHTAGRPVATEPVTPPAPD